MTPRRAARLQRIKEMKEQEAIAIRLHQANAVTYEQEKAFEKELREMKQARYNMADQRDEERADALDAVRNGPFEFKVKVNIKTFLRNKAQRVMWAGSFYNGESP